MESAYDGRQVVGMDLHRRRSMLVRMTEDGRKLGAARISNSPAELRREWSAPRFPDGDPIGSSTERTGSSAREETR
jgi:hypothetical protein